MGETAEGGVVDRGDGSCGDGFHDDDETEDVDDDDDNEEGPLMSASADAISCCSC